jgi:hypothetical protein
MTVRAAFMMALAAYGLVLLTAWGGWLAGALIR